MNSKPQIGDDVEYAARLLRDGYVTAFATETVYGLGAVASNPQVVAAMYALKNRPRNHPSIVHLADFSEAEQWAEVPDVARKLAARFMPGPLTLLLPAKKCAGTLSVNISDNIKSPTDTAHINADEIVALRVPSHSQARQLLAKVGEGVFAPSANLFGGVSPTTALHVAAEFPDSPLYILDGGACQVGLESSIVSCLFGKVSVVRPGMLSADEIAKAANVTLSPPPKVAAPGQLLVHYAPRKPLRLVDSGDILQATASDAVLSQKRPPQVPITQWRQSSPTPTNYARQLYALLRELDATTATCIMVEKPPDALGWEAVRDRLGRAAAKTV